MAISQVNSNGFGPTSWTTATRPSLPFTGMQGFNTSLVAMEYYNGTTWQPVVANYTYSASYLVIAGGGGGGNYSNPGGGGGAGGYRTSVTGQSSGGGGSAESAITLTVGTVYTATVGSGGAASVSGTDSSFSGSGITTITSVGSVYQQRVTGGIIEKRT